MITLIISPEGDVLDDACTIRGCCAIHLPLALQKYIIDVPNARFNMMYITIARIHPYLSDNLIDYLWADYEVDRIDEHGFQLSLNLALPLCAHHIVHLPHAKFAVQIVMIYCSSRRNLSWFAAHSWILGTRCISSSSNPFNFVSPTDFAGELIARSFISIIKHSILIEQNYTARKRP